METRNLGNTGFEISRIVFGCGAVGGVIFKPEMTESVEAYFNILNPSAVKKVPKGFAAQDFAELATHAKEQGLSVLNIRVLAAGALAGTVLDEKSAGIVNGAGGQAENLRVRRVSEELGIDVQELYSLALRFAFMRAEIDGVLIGFSTPDHVDQAIAELSAPQLPEDTLRRVEALYASPLFAG